ncbi:GNAT family N-acetyltransferase [Saccharopolyspora sp. NFXS83]|uniref:GNAT family N-acetyltransferase n=1 Tax=Saccharopolyspora sp. NFXS83 TaxID=2993560 RepID=UPI00224AE301|nr:GNAT family N-acetyltransferase [Saccharopolyspora sp. NFXS83]MCX2732343.1 GNAT family N-acetyltransferase [Saccharopolyspora sp. NFXS83]
MSGSTSCSPAIGAVDRIFEVERAAADTWPATTVLESEGWLLRHCDRLRRGRSNSALPPRHVRDLESSVDELVRFYVEREAPPLVQVGPMPWHAELDEHLAARGFRRDGPVRVLTSEGVLDTAAPDVRVRLDAEPTPGWLAASVAAGGRAEPALAAIGGPVRFATAEVDGVPAGVGLFAVRGSWCAVYCMATVAGFRRRGIARSVLRAGARWARESGAAELFLQVAADNEPAVRLYARCGFELSHEYHYRVADTRI